MFVFEHSLSARLGGMMEILVLDLSPEIREKVLSRDYSLETREKIII